MDAKEAADMNMQFHMLRNSYFQWYKYFLNLFEVLALIQALFLAPGPGHLIMRFRFLILQFLGLSSRMTSVWTKPSRLGDDVLLYLTHNVHVLAMRKTIILNILNTYVTCASSHRRCADHEIMCVYKFCFLRPYLHRHNILTFTITCV